MSSKKELVAIEYFVFMKAETTGRQWEDNQPTKIAELCFIAVNRRDIERGEAKLMPAATKLNMILNSQRYIQEAATDSHKLTVPYVANALTFAQSAGCIVAFLQQLPKPVCLVAHNGFSFDYKHLKRECIDAGVELPEDLLCADSRWIFHYVLKSIPSPVKGLQPDSRPTVDLESLYTTLFETVEKPVTAEQRVMMLLDCVLHKKYMFLQEIANRHKNFSEVKETT